MLFWTVFLKDVESDNESARAFCEEASLEMSLEMSLTATRHEAEIQLSRPGGICR